MEVRLPGLLLRVLAGEKVDPTHIEAIARADRRENYDDDRLPRMHTCKLCVYLRMIVHKLTLQVQGQVSAEYTSKQICSDIQPMYKIARLLPKHTQKLADCKSTAKVAMEALEHDAQTLVC